MHCEIENGLKQTEKKKLEKLMDEKKTPPPWPGSSPGTKPRILFTPSAKQHGEYAARWLREHPADHPHRIFVERIREAAKSHPEKVTEEIVRFIKVIQSEKKSDGGTGAQEIPDLP